MKIIIKKKKFTKKEVDIIYDNCFKSSEEISLLLNRTTASIRRFLVYNKISLKSLRKKKINELNIKVKRGRVNISINDYMTLINKHHK